MSSKTIIKIILLTGIFVWMAFLLVGCGGGGGGSEGLFSAGGSGGTGSVALFLADGPADDYDQILITITEILLLPPEGSGNKQVVLFRDPNGMKVDLLDLRDEDLLITVKKRVRAQKYEKIRLVISDIEPVGGPCADFKLSSGKIDLNPRGTFEVVAGETLSVRFDLDANKCMNVSKACNFRPVVFVDIEHGAPLRPCPRILAGTIASIKKRGDIVVGFVLDLPGQRGDLEVRVADDTAVFDQNGEFGGRDLLDGQEGERVHVRGRLDKDARLQASVVVLGNVLVVKGDVDGPVDDVTNLFPFTPFEYEAIRGSYDVEVADETLILIGCDDEVAKEAIQTGMIARVIGKLVRVDDVDVLRSVVVFLRARAISGQITSTVDEGGGKTVTVDQDTDGEIDVFVSAGTPVYIEGDGSVSMEVLCVGRQVRIFIDPEPEIPTRLEAKSVLVQSERRVGVVDSVGDPREYTPTLTIDGESVFVQPGATILDTRGTVDTLVGFEAIEVNDELQYFGLEACPGDVGFDAFVILITG